MKLQILNRNIPKKQLNAYAKTVKSLLVQVTALAGVQQEQPTLQNTKKWNTTNSPKISCSKRISGVSDESNCIQIIKGSLPLMVLKFRIKLST